MTPIKRARGKRQLAVRVPFLLREWREFRGLLNSEMAAALGVTRGCLSCWEHGKREISVKMLERFAHLVGCDLETFWRGPVLWQADRARRRAA